MTAQHPESYAALLPCPHCGSQASIRIWDHERGPDGCRVECISNTCGGWMESSLAAIESWNRRSTSWGEAVGLAIDVLADVQWKGVSVGSNCPSCGGYEAYNHTEKCRLSKALLALRALSPAPTLTWTREKPTVEGWYWHRWKSNGGEPVHIVIGKFGPYIEKGGEIHQMISDAWGLWCPIPEPIEPKPPDPIKGKQDAV